MNFSLRKIGTFFLLLVSIFILSGCNFFGNNEPKDQDGGATPIYQGMTISDSVQKLSLNTVGINSMYLGVRINRLLSNSSSIEDFFGNEFEFENNEELDYYSAINTDLYINVRLHNPDGQAILRFTLNGVVYQSFQFQEGSDSENLILRVNSGTVVGIKEYTIDEIKYVENVTNNIKDVLFEGDRTVKLGVTYNSIPTAIVTNEVVNATSFSFDLTISDSQNLISKSGNLLKVLLYDGKNIVQSKDIAIGNSNVRFEKLSPTNNYEYAVATVYDLLDGNNKKIHILHSGEINTSNLLGMDNVVSTQDAITFEVNVTDADEVGSITSIELYQGETLVEALTDLSLRTFSDLLSNNAYQIKVTYTYDLNDGVGSQTLTINQSATTLAKATPTVVIDNVVPTQTSIGFGITVTDVDQVGAVSAIELSKGETLVEALTDLSVREFTGLLSNNQYTVKVTYTYNLNDGVGSQTLTINQSATTLAKATPTVVIDNVVPTQTSIGFGITVTDVDQVGSVSAIELYKGETLVEALTDLSVREFTGLLSNNEYTVKVTYTFDLNDGVGEQDFIISQALTTLPQPIVITSLTVLNSSTPSVGDVVEMKIQFENSDNLNLVQISINENYYDIVSLSNTSLVVYFTPITDGGVYSFTIDSIIYEDHSKQLSLEIPYYESNITILGTINITDLYSDNNHIIEENIVNVLYLEIDNPTNYDIYTITLNYNGTDYKYASDEITQISSNVFQVEWKGRTYYGDYILVSVKIKEIEYGSQDSSSSKQFNLEYKFWVLHSAQAISINDRIGLENIQSGYVYSIDNDIDLSNSNWSPIEFSGIIYGNDHVISGLTIVDGFNNASEHYIGLFSQLQGEISNIRILDVYISVSTNDGIHVGVLAGETSNVKIENITTSGTIIANIEEANYSQYDIGGLVGNAEYSDEFYRIQSSVNIVADMNIIDAYYHWLMIGGISGARGTFYDSIYSGSISVNSNSYTYIGGICGNYGNMYRVIMIGEIYLNNDGSSVLVAVSGIAGFGYPVIEDSIMAGTVTVEGTSGLLGDIYAYQSYSTSSNSYVYNNTTILLNGTEYNTFYGIQIGSEDINSDFFTQILSWDEAIWDFSTLNFDEDQYPKLLNE